MELSQFAGNVNLSEQLGTEYPLQSLVNPLGTWITNASLERLESEKNRLKYECWRDFDREQRHGNTCAKLLHKSYLNTPYNLSAIRLPIAPLTSLGTQIGLHHKQLGSIDYGYYHLNKTHQIAASLGVTPFTPKIEGNLHIVQWAINPLTNSKQPKRKNETCQTHSFN